MAKILVADDDVHMVNLLTMTLPADYEVSQALDGDAAVSMAERIVPDLILLDLVMPGLSGVEVLRRVKSSENLQKTKVIMVTGRNQETDRSLCTSLGADDYLSKPFSPLALLEQVTDLLNGI